MILFILVDLEYKYLFREFDKPFLCSAIFSLHSVDAFLVTRRGSDRLTAEPNTLFSSSENLVVVVPYLRELQATFRHSLPKVR